MIIVKKTMKKTLAIVLAIFMIVSTVPMAFAATTVAEGTAGEGIIWVLDSDGKLTISGTGEIETDWFSPPWQEYNESITSVVIEEGITRIDGTAFADAEKLVTVSIPSTVTTIGPYVFWNCSSLEEINVHEDNAYYKIIDGILFTEDEKTLVYYPANKAGAEYTVHATVTRIEDYAFESNVLLESLTIPDTVTYIGESFIAYSNVKYVYLGNGITELKSCFSHSDVKSLIIPDSVKTIGYATFWSAEYLETLVIGSGVETIDKNILRYTSNLSVVHYKGTQEDWDKITIDETNDDLDSKSIHFISEDSYNAGVTPTCVDGHTAGYYCGDCNAYVSGKVIPAVDEHKPGAEVDENIVSPDCTTAGSKDVVTYCTVCGEEASRETVTLDATSHTDNDADGYCNICDELICNHNCHKGGIVGFFWNITRFFNKLFKTNQYCECGAAHY